MVQISSRWGGLGTPAASELTIVKHGASFRLGHKNIAPELMDSLVVAVKQADISDLNLANLDHPRMARQES
jgi:hypothetical protein